MSGEEKEAATPEAARQRDGRRTFAPVVLVGLASAVAAAVAGHKPMLEVPDAEITQRGLAAIAGQGAAQAEFPLVGALALVAIACWGVLLVSRGRVRRAVAALAALSSAGTFAVVVIGGFVQKSNARDDIADNLGLSVVSDQLKLDWTPWFWVALVASVVATGAAVAAVLYVPEWPEMGSKYDAPTSHDAAGTGTPAEERTSLDLWKSMDEGEDPTDGPAADPDETSH
ncbi:Trp biosynthesis-associated membrane protein [Nocardioides sp. MH1]|uniref:Trp biosynthesis-associated membrane protein n=1 Tax=Nocardioides sp. MH1 TaxID=3242490 RepID=UPI0035210618